MEHLHVIEAAGLGGQGVGEQPGFAGAGTHEDGLAVAQMGQSLPEGGDFILVAGLPGGVAHRRADGARVEIRVS